MPRRHARTMEKHQRIIVPIRGLRFIWRYSLQEEITARFSVSHHAGVTWQFEHAILYIVSSSVSKSAFKSYARLNYKEPWGQLTSYPITSSPSIDHYLSTPENTSTGEFSIFTLSGLKNTGALRERLLKLHEYLETTDDIFDTIKLQRHTVNTNLRRWLRDGWLRPTHHYWHNGWPNPRDLKPDQFFDCKSRQIMNREMESEAVEAARSVLDAIGWKYTLRQQSPSG